MLSLSSHLKCIALTLAFSLCNLAQAEQKEVFGDYEVHYNVFNSTFLQPQVAQQYEINRSRAVGVVNIAVLKKNPEGGLPQPVAAAIEGEVTNQVQQQNRLAFRRVTEGQSVYYLADFHFSQNDPLVFTVRVYGDPNQPPMALRFSKTLFAD